MPAVCVSLELLFETRWRRLPGLVTWASLTSSPLLFLNGVMEISHQPYAPAPTPAVLAAGAFLLASSAGAALGVVTFA